MAHKPDCPRYVPPVKKTARKKKTEPKPEEASEDEAVPAH